MSPSNQTWRVKASIKPSTSRTLRITPSTSIPTPTPNLEPPADDTPSRRRRFNLFDGTANVPRRPDYFVNERRTYPKLLKRKINSAPLPPLPPKIEYGETMPWPEWRPKTPPRERKEGVRMSREYWQSRYVKSLPLHLISVVYAKAVVLIRHV